MAGKKNAYDKTRTKRSAAHMDRLRAEEGGRVTVDFDQEGHRQLADLKEAGFGSNKSEVIRKAVSEAHDRLKKSS